MRTEIITKGSKAVVINTNGEGYGYWANLYVNYSGDLRNADITGLRWTGKTSTGARKWAKKALS